MSSMLYFYGITSSHLKFKFGTKERNDKPLLKQKRGIFYTGYICLQRNSTKSTQINIGNAFHEAEIIVRLSWSDAVLV